MLICILLIWFQTYFYVYVPVDANTYKLISSDVTGRVYMIFYVNVFYCFPLNKVVLIHSLQQSHQLLVVCMHGLLYAVMMVFLADSQLLVIVGAAVGALAALATVAVVVFFIVRRAGTASLSRM